MELLKLLSANEIVAQLVSFFVLLFLMRIFAWKKILGLLDARKERIACEFKRIEDAKADIARIKVEYEEKLGVIDEQARQRIQAAVEQGNKIIQQMRDDAHRESQRIIDNAKENIKSEIAEAKEELRDSIVDLAIKSAEVVVQSELTEKEDRKLVEDFLKSLEKQI